MKKLYFYFINFISAIILKFNKVSYGSRVKINGIIRVRNKGRLIIGNNVTINSSYLSNPVSSSSYSSFVVNETGCLSIGNNVGISNSFIYCRAEISIEDNVMIGNGTTIVDTDFHSISLSERMAVGDRGKKKKVEIKYGAFIGMGSILLKGTIIGRESVIAAGSVVHGIVPDKQVWGGNPAKFIREIDNVDLQ